MMPMRANIVGPPTEVAYFGLGAALKAFSIAFVASKIA
jgi:hypothetical protein